MDIEPEDSTLQAVFGSLDQDPLDLKQLEEYLSNDEKSPDLYLDDNANFNFGYTADQLSGQSPSQPIPSQPGVMFYTGPKLECGSATTGLPIDIPNFSAHYKNVPLTPPDSDGPDSPVDQRVMHSSILGPSPMDIRQLMLTRAAMGTSFPTPGSNSSDVTSHLIRRNSDCEPKKKRKRADDCEKMSLNGRQSIKTEPGLSEDDIYLGGSVESLNTASEMESNYQCLKWQPYKTTQWSYLYDESLNKLPTPEYRVDADKGFNFSFADDAFVCQKKNHFQITIHLDIDSAPKFIKTKDGFKPVEKFRLHLYGVKMESQSCHIKIEQSQTDRSKRSYEPVTLHLSSKEAAKVTVGRLHFSETTSNNMRKKGKPNPDQRYFLLAVSVHAQVSKNEDYLLCSNVSERIIVRTFAGSQQASNPGQFENDVEVVWSRGQTTDSVFRMGRVGINTDRPDESLSVHGNLKVTGHFYHPSDQRVKRHITEVDSSEQLRNVTRMKLYTYRFTREFLEHAGLSGDDEEPTDTGVLAQDLKEVLPDAVREADDIILSNGEKIEKFLIVDKERIFMENVGAVKELCKLTDKLETRIEELECMNKKLQKRRCDTGSSVFSCTSGISSFSRSSSVRCSRKSTSSGKPDESSEKSRRRHHHHCRRRNRAVEHAEAVDQNYCTPRFMQVLVVLLITVMGLSVAAMATLYVMQNDDASEPRDSVSIAWEEKPSNFILTTLKQEDDVMASSISTSLPKLSSPRSSTAFHATVTDVLVPTESQIIKRGQSASNGSRSGDHSSTNPEGTEPIASVSSPTTPSPQCCNNANQNFAPDIAGKEVYYDSSTSTGHQSSSDDPEIRLLEKDYALRCDGACQENSTFYIPFSPDIPFQAVTVEINSTHQSQVLLCGTSTKHDCPEQSTHPSYDTTRKKGDWDTCHRWKLPVAYYYQSSYYFRVVLTNQNSIDCNSSLLSHSGQIRDLHLYFIRKCSR